MSAVKVKVAACRSAFGNERLLEREEGRIVGNRDQRKDSIYRSGRSPDWLKMKNPAAPAVKREAEEDWGKGKWR